MKTKYLLILLALFALTMPAKAYDFMVNGLCYNYNEDGTSVAVTFKNWSTSNPSYTNLSGALNIPSSVYFCGKTYSVTKIGNYAFQYCSSLTSVTIPNSVTVIGSYAFQYSSLKSLTIGKSVTSFGEFPFKMCYGLTSVVWNAKSCADFTVWEKTQPFNSLTGIKSFTFGNEVERIPACICYGLSGLTSVTIPNSVTEIGDLSFSGCSGLTSVTIPNSVTTIGAVAFRGCRGLTSVTIPNSVTSIGQSAFTNCSGLTSLTIGNSVTSIGTCAFSDCSGLTSVTIPISVTSIDSYAFGGCSGLTSVVWNAKSCKDIVNKNCCPFLSVSGTNLTGIKSFTFGNDVEKIPSYICYGLSGLTSVTIGNSVTTIGKFAFNGCRGLTSVTIPNSVTEIGCYAFYDCRRLTSIIIGNSVTSIDNNAFNTSTPTNAFGTSDTIYSLNPTPPQIDYSTFNTGRYKATLFVPIGSKPFYKVAPYWKYFYNIKETEYDGINNVVIDRPVNLLENPDEIKTIYTIDGRRLNPQDVLWLPNGIYIVNGKKILINR